MLINHLYYNWQQEIISLRSFDLLPVTINLVWYILATHSQVFHNPALCNSAKKLIHQRHSLMNALYHHPASVWNCHFLFNTPITVQNFYLTFHFLIIASFWLKGQCQNNYFVNVLYLLCILKINWLKHFNRKHNYREAWLY